MDFISNDVLCSWGLWLTNRSIKLPSLRLFVFELTWAWASCSTMYVPADMSSKWYSVKPRLCALLRDCVCACIVGLTLQVTFSFVFLIPLTFGWHLILYKEKIGFMLLNPHYNAWGTGLCSLLVIVDIEALQRLPHPHALSLFCKDSSCSFLPLFIFPLSIVLETIYMPPASFHLHVTLISHLSLMSLCTV